ncbi:MAG TPA: PAS domain-containing sensor histidine kinase, partial [Thermoanaerobaculia bacterium]
MRRLRHDRRILLYAALAALPAVAVALLILWLGDFAPRTRWTLTAVIVLSWIAFASSLWERLVRPLQTVSNLLAAMREGDFSIRARGARAGDPLGEVLFEV